LDNQMLIIISQRLMVGAFSHEDMVWLRAKFNAPNLNESDISDERNNPGIQEKNAQM
ncbi:hypothetical protein MJL22_28600, partial [Salmonella enterica subsp. enterica serovar Montevideo]|nr:hypothetical protein [Salmonella enterica subsp. enterica serovar Montevideo]